MRLLLVPASILALLPALGAPAAAGELVLRTGQHVRADLAARALVLSTGSDLLEIPAGDVAEITADAVRLSDGRVVRGTLVGGQLRTRTELGELTVPIETLEVFRTAEPAPPAPAPETAAAAPAPPPAPPAAESETGPGAVVEGARRIGRGVEQAAKGVGRTVSEGADRIHDGVKAVGLAIWDGMKGVGRAAGRAFTE